MSDADAINKALAAIAMTGGGTLKLEPQVYVLEKPLRRSHNVTIAGAYNGANLFDMSVLTGTVLRWHGEEGPVILDKPTDGDWKIDNGGVRDLTIDGSGIASIGLQSMSAYYAKYTNIHCMGVKKYAFYFGTYPSDHSTPNIHCRLDDLTAIVTGQACGIVLDGTPGSGRNTCFVSARNCHVTFQNGIAYALANCDDCGFTDCAASRGHGFTGTAIWFGGSSDGSLKAAYGNRFIGFNSNAPISAASGTSPSRGNLVMTNAVDGLPLIYQQPGATLTAEIYDGELGLDGFVRNPLHKG